MSKYAPDEYEQSAHHLHLLRHINTNLRYDTAVFLARRNGQILFSDPFVLLDVSDAPLPWLPRVVEVAGQRHDTSGQDVFVALAATYNTQLTADRLFALWQSGMNDDPITHRLRFSGYYKRIDETTWAAIFNAYDRSTGERRDRPVVVNRHFVRLVVDEGDDLLDVAWDISLTQDNRVVFRCEGALKAIIMPMFDRLFSPQRRAEESAILSSEVASNG